MSTIGIDTEIGIKLKDELCTEYDWFYNNFLTSVQDVSDEFFSDLFEFRFLSLSKNINLLFEGEEYFVTKIRIDKQHDAFFRCSSSAIDIILKKILGPTEDFKLEKITALEAKIISSFNDSLYNRVSRFIMPPPPKTHKRKNFDTIHLTFFIRDKETLESAKIIISLPAVLLSPVKLDVDVPKFDVSGFHLSKVDVNIKIGKTRFSLKDLKSLEKDDMVIFEDSNIHLMKLVYGGYEREFSITPNPGLVTSIDNDNNAGGSMEGQSFSQNLWDNIQVEMGAEFDKVKITLGELKGIEQGLVLDLASVYDNKISLKVENKTIAKGELVIINDRYGVRIDEVFAADGHNFEQSEDEYLEDPQEEMVEEEQEYQEFNPEEEELGSEEEFDYSDFELDDQDI